MQLRCDTLVTMSKSLTSLRAPILYLALLLAAPTLAGEAGVPRISPAEAAAQMTAGKAILVDVRERDEIAGGMAQGARWYPTSSIQSDPDSFAKFIASLPEDQTVVFYCAAGVRAGKAAEIATKESGRKAANLGGFKDWKGAGLPVITPAETFAPG
jgi:rhodanese-related sulfurtransferase